MAGAGVKENGAGEYRLLTSIMMDFSISISQPPLASDPEKRKNILYINQGNNSSEHTGI